MIDWLQVLEKGFAAFFIAVAREGVRALQQVLRLEKKYLLTLEEAKCMSGKLQKIMHQDPHNGAEGYLIRSLYFDTIVDGDYFDKLEGLDVRRKLRLRCYEPKDAYAKLEMKQKQGEQQKKRSLKLSREEAEALCRGDYHVFLTKEEPFAAECYALMQMRCYRPRSVVEYRRMAFIAKENNIRVTFDRDIRANEACFDLFSPKLCLTPVFDPSHVVVDSGGSVDPYGGGIHCCSGYLYFLCLYPSGDHIQPQI